MAEWNDKILDPLSDSYTRFTRSVYSRTDDAEYPAQRVGSGTVIAYQGEFYLVTARHIFENNKADPIGVIVSFPVTGNNWWPTDACIHLEASEEFAEDNAFGDLALYSLHTTADIRSAISDYDFLPFPMGFDLSPETPLYAFGYPDAEVDVDLELNQHVLTMVAVEGSYRTATKYVGIHTFHSPNLPIELNGMSGGAITYLDIRRPGRHLLAGIIVQGGSKCLHFIGADMVRQALLQYIPNLQRIRGR